MPYTPPHQRNIPPDHRAIWVRQRSSSTLPTFPYIPGNYYHGPNLTNPFGPIPLPPLPPPVPQQQPSTESAPRIQLPIHPHLPFIIDPSSFQMAVNHDPKHTFESVQALMKERDELKKANNELKAENNTLKAARNSFEVQNKALEAQNKALVVENKKVNENCESAKLDHRVARERIQMMEQLISVQSAKQVILWKFIWRLKNGETGPRVDEDGFWRPTKGPMAPVSEASQPSSDRSYASTAGSKDNSETKLDPHAQAFVPQSPVKTLLESESLMLYTPTKQETMDDKGTTPTNETGAFIDPNINPIDEDFKEVIVKLPAQFFGVCPNSLSTPGPCPLIHCRLQPLCEDFNDENGPGCQNRFCQCAHIYRSCTEELDGVGCSYMQIPETSAKKKSHFIKRAHPYGNSGITKKEWQMRVAIAELRGAHKAQRY